MIKIMRNVPAAKRAIAIHSAVFLLVLSISALGSFFLPIQKSSAWILLPAMFLFFVYVSVYHLVSLMRKKKPAKKGVKK